jgi:hypothetical protein
MVRYLVAAAMTVALALPNTILGASTAYKGYAFEAYVVRSTGKRYKEFQQNNRSTLKVRPNEEYSIVVKNPMPVRVGVAVSIDGLNSIDGKRTTPAKARKWLIEPHSSITIAGWQTSKQTLRKFLFTQQTESYAQFQEDKGGKPLTRNLGVIGVAWFWNSGELEIALHPPEPFEEETKRVAAEAAGAAPSRAAPSAAPAAAKADAKAGTGMGKQQQNLVTEVEFSEDAGMYAVKDVLKIYYEFAKEPPEPLPFVDDEAEEGRFAPEMPK